jgi:5-hydroxyisourate hydrolase
MITTHVLDTARGRPAAGVRVTVEARAGDGWTTVGGGVTDADGRVPGLVPAGARAAGGHPPALKASTRR